MSITQLSSDIVQQAGNKCYIIPVAKACNADCIFCVTNTYHTKSASTYMPTSNKLESTFEQLYAAGVRYYEITGGGEPTLHPKLKEISNAIKTLGGVHIKLYTNGIFLKPEFHVDELNISRCSLDENNNQKLMRYKHGKKSLINILENARDLGYKNVRLSIPIIKDGIETIEQAKEIICAVKKLITGIVFRPLYIDTPNRYSLFVNNFDPTAWEIELRNFINKQRIDLNIEIDSIACEKPAYLILNSDLNFYSDWNIYHVN